MKPAHIRHIQHGYDAWARPYDWFARLTASVGGIRQRCIEALELDTGETVVEFGCGPGINIVKLQEAIGPSGKAVGVDISANMLGRAKARADKQMNSCIELVQADATEPPVHSADAVLATFVSSLFPDPYSVIKNWCDLADRVVIASFTPGSNTVANIGLAGFAQLNKRLFDLKQSNPLTQLQKRTEIAHQALKDHMNTTNQEAHLWGTIGIAAGKS
jgi:SAM-dependent methyltransferase